MIDKIKDVTACPHCGILSAGRNSILIFFGFRKMDDTIRVQSWCRKCREDFESATIFTNWLKPITLKPTR